MGSTSRAEFTHGFLTPLEFQLGMEVELRFLGIVRSVSTFDDNVEATRKKIFLDCMATGINKSVVQKTLEEAEQGSTDAVLVKGRKAEEK